MTFDFSDEGLLEADEWLMKQQKLLCPEVGGRVTSCNFLKNEYNTSSRET